ncbi:MAG: hypothetical protein HGA51_03405 [Demequinaceae bacterium]|nr:hypothetical protein [Demequinaceae bacterium]
MTRRIGAYVLPGDTVWLQRSLGQYYPILDALVVPVPQDGRGWTGVPIPVGEALELIRAVDTRGIMRTIPGSWTDRVDPMRADTAQRQAAVDALAGEVDWVLQIDNDEYLPRPESLHRALDEAERQGIDAVEWPMRVLYRRTRKRVLEVVSVDGQPHYDYPGPIAVRSGARLRDARRSEGGFLRLVVRGDHRSLQVARPLETGELRVEFLDHEDAILHNSWAREPAATRQKLASWGHSTGAGFNSYYWFRWWPSPLLWRVQRDLHPFARELWPALRSRANRGELSD